MANSAKINLEGAMLLEQAFEKVITLRFVCAHVIDNSVDTVRKLQEDFPYFPKTY